MALRHFKNLLKNPLLPYFEGRYFSQKYEYEIPERYRNAFYLANASLVDTTNWFVHNALREIYADLIEELGDKGHSVPEAMKQISNIINILEPCNQTIDLQFPVKNENGKYTVFRGFRAQHGSYIAKRPCLGGLRICQVIQKSDIKALAALSTYKYACMGIDMLGAHGGIMIPEKNLKKKELYKIIDTYTMELTKRGFCGRSEDVIEPDMNCGFDEMTWIIAAHAKIKGCLSNACAVGKLPSYGGIENSETMWGHGIFFGLDAFINDKSIMNKIQLETGWSSKTFVVQGLGKVGISTAQCLISAGVKCIGIIDEDCYIYDEKGINVKEALCYKRKHRTLDGFMSKTKSDEPNQVLISQCDILVLAALQNSLSYHIVKKVRAKIIVEAANAPIPPSVHKVLIGQDKLVLPDIYINSGSSLVSYIEYTKNMQQIPNDVEQNYTNELVAQFVEECHQRNSRKWRSYSQANTIPCRVIFSTSETSSIMGILNTIMKRTAKNIVATAKQYSLGLDFRTAAYIIALKKLFWTTYRNLENDNVKYTHY